MKIDLRLLQNKNAAFLDFNIKEEDFLSENDVALRAKTGIIYIIVNLVNGKVYVGQTLKTFKQRYKKGWWLTTDNDHLLKSAQKYGYENFQILIMEENREQNILNILETYYILKFRSNEKEYGYNKTTGGNSYSFSSDTKEKMRLASPLLFTKEKFIDLAREKHGNKFDYSEVNYYNSNSNIKIYCKCCQNYFEQTPGTHLISKIACPNCVLKDASKRYSMSFEEFKRRSQEKFNDEFEYYPETFNKIHGSTKLKHKKCGNILLFNNAYSHLISKTGCWFCGLELRKQSSKDSLEKIELKKAAIINELHLENNDKNFSLRQLQQKLYLKKRTESNQIKIKQKREEWYNNLVQKSKKVHGETSFGYLACGLGRKKSLILKCNECDLEFKSRIYEHLKGRGCPSCSYKEQGVKRRLLFNKFIKRAIIEK